MAEDAVAAKRRRWRTGGGGDDIMSALPDHVLHEVLSRVGTVKDQFMLAVTCRRWLGRFTDRAFLRDIVCPGQGQVLLGFFLQDALQRATVWARGPSQLASSCLFVPVPGSPLGPGPTARALTSSLVADGGGAFDYAVPLGARRGIVLMQCINNCHGDTELLLGVCNPVTGERHLLVPLDMEPTSICAYAIITAADVHADAAGSARFTFSHLLVANFRKDIYLYSAATRSWSHRCVVDDGRSFHLTGERSAVVHQGAAHWLFWCHDTGSRYDDDPSLYKLSVQLGGGAAGPICSAAFTRIPGRVSRDPLLCVTGDGKLAVVYQTGGHVEVVAWEKTVFTIPAAVPYPPWVLPPKETWFHLSRGSMLAIYRSSAVFIVDLHRKTLEKVMDCFLPLFKHKKNRTAVPYEMDLVDFFMLKLGALSSAGPSG
nr:unnamed protein product [Digitaria exilis]